MKVECFGVVSYRDNPVNPEAQFAQVRQHVTDRIVPERVLPLAKLHAVSFDVLCVLAPGTELLYADEIGNMSRGPV